MEGDHLTDSPIEIVGCHAEGEVGDVIVSGVEPPPGKTLWEQSRWIHEHGDLRRYVLNEPRGGVFRHVNLLVPPVHSAAAAGFIIMEPEDTPPMSGSNAMCVATVLLNEGLVPMREPITRFQLEAPGGLVQVEAMCEGGKAREITLQNVPSFVDRLDASVEVPGFGAITVDTAFGGDSFVIANARSLGFELADDEATDLVSVGKAIAAAATDQLGFSHPNLPELRHFSFGMLAGPVQIEQGVAATRHAVVIRPGKLDRSPTGTGVSARLAVLHARGQAALGDSIRFRSVIGSEFVGQIADFSRVGDRAAIVARISGRAFVYERRTLLHDPADPWPRGYRLRDTWPQDSL